MSPQLNEVRCALGQHLVGKTINLLDVSDDAYEILGRITEVRLEGNLLSIKTSETRRRWWADVISVPFRKEFCWDDVEFEPFYRNEFCDSLELIADDSKIQPDGTILLIPWGGYDYVYIRP